MEILAWALPDNELLSLWLINYGSIAIFFLLALGIILLPVPEETLMVISGILISQGKLHLVYTAFAAYSGSMCGITVSYLVGKTGGVYLLTKYGKWFGITHSKLKVAHNWFERYGKWALFIGYFIPGVRHFTGLSAGITALEYGTFALFAYVGALFWVSTFLSIGYFIGDYWLTIFHHVENSLENIIIAFIGLCAVILFGYFYYKKIHKPKSRR